MNSNKFVDLKRRIDERLSSNIVKDTDEEISLYTLRECIKNAISGYNDVFINDAGKLCKIINKETILNRLFKGQVPNVDSIESVVLPNGLVNIEAVLCDFDGRKAGILNIDNRCNMDITFLRPVYSKEKTIDMFRKHSIKFVEYLNKLYDFTKEYPNTKCAWNSKSTQMHEMFDDGFLTAHFYLERPDSSRFSFSSDEDIAIASIKSKDFGELHEFIDFYNDELLKKTSVNINDLNDLYKKIVHKELNIKNGPILSKNK